MLEIAWIEEVQLFDASQQDCLKFDYWPKLYVFSVSLFFYWYSCGFSLAVSVSVIPKTLVCDDVCPMN